MTDEEWRALERAHEAAPADQAVLERLIQARRRLGLPVPGRLLMRRSHPARAVPPELTGWFLTPADPKRPVFASHALDLAPISLATLPEHCAFAVDATPAHLKRPAGLRSLLREHEIPGVSITDASGSGPLDLAALRGLKSVEWVSVFARSVNDAGLAPLAFLENLTALFLRGTAVTGTGVVSLTRLPRLGVLTINGQAQLGTPAPTREGVAAIGMLSHLTDLSLTGMEPGAGEGLALLAGLPHLESLHLRGIVDADLAHVAALPHLRTLSLRGCVGLTERGIAHLRSSASLVALEVSPDFWKGMAPGALASLEAARPGLVVTP